MAISNGSDLNANLPSGTVTFLFTDIESSTKLAQQYPDALPALLGRHNAIVREAIESHHGHVFRIIGDAFCAAFPTPSDGLKAALTAQRALQHEPWIPAPVQVRMGVHTGEAHTGLTEKQSDPYVGYLTLTRVQRVMSTAHGGQILLSNSSADVIREELPADISLRDMGEHRLKGLFHLEHLWQIVTPGLQQDFAPLQTLDVTPNNLPASVNRFVGRSRELKEVKERLARTRLLTLLGPGGTGKTRLALQAAADLLNDYEDRVYFVDLAASRDPEAVLAAIAQAVGLREKSDRPLLDDLKGQIKQKKMLLLLDNFEQVTVAASTVSELLRDCPELRLLVTSREALHLQGENVFAVPPLALPLAEFKQLSLEQLTQSEAVQLFVERAQSVKSSFKLTNDNAKAVAEICLRLDGLPLAIELVTARLNVFTPQVLAERLVNRLKLLQGGARDLPVRQQTLRDTVDWSYEMLDAGERALFELLSVFSGATLEAIDAAASRIKRFAESGVDILEKLSSIVDKSLIRQMEDGRGASRYQMLETIREFASAQLDEDPEFSAAAHRAHATYYAEFTYDQWGHFTGEGRKDAQSRLTSDLENIQTAWHFWAGEGNLELLGKFTDSLWLYYDLQGWYHGAVQLTTDLLKVLSSTVSTPERAREEIILQTSLARALLATKGYTAEVERAYARALELCQSAGEIPQLFPVLRGLSSFHGLRTEFGKGVELGERILNLAERLDDMDMKVEGHLVLGYNLGFHKDIQIGLEHLEKGIALYDPNRPRTQRLVLGGNPGVIGLAVSGLLLWMIGFPDRARTRASDAIALARKLDHPFSIAYAHFHSGLLHHWLGNFEIAEARAREVVELAEEYEFVIWSAVGWCLRGAAMVQLGSTGDGLSLIEQGMNVYRGLKTPPVFWPMLLYLHAEAYGAASRPADGLPLLNEAMEIASASTSKLLASEFLGLKGDLLLALSPDNAAEAESWFQGAVTNAQQVNASMLELRAAMRLCRLWQQQRKTVEAARLLGDAYAKITEGFSTVDLKQARGLLADLS